MASEAARLSMRAARAALRPRHCHRQWQSTASTPRTSPFSPRHLLSCADLSSSELQSLVRSAYHYKQAFKSGSIPNALLNSMFGKVVAMVFNKRSTRTRVSTESAVARLGGSSMFLGKDDIQLGVNETLRDTATVISSMVSAVVARVAAHSDIKAFTQYSTVPIINALSDDFHPLQALADTLTLFEAFPVGPRHKGGSVQQGSPLEGIKLAWVGDANNVLFDLAIAAGKLGMDVAVATPRGYGIPADMKTFIGEATVDASRPGTLTETNVPEEAVKDADVVFTDTWISMGQEAEKQKRLNAFQGFQVTSDMMRRGCAKEDWLFMHCLPRHPEEVSDEVFYDQRRSLVFQEAENRLWTTIAVLEAFVVREGKIPNILVPGTSIDI